MDIEEKKTIAFTHIIDYWPAIGMEHCWGYYQGATFTNMD